MGKFAFELGQKVKIKASGEEGEVAGRAEYANGAPNNYFLRYKAADGRATESWWEEGTIESAE